MHEYATTAAACKDFLISSIGNIGRVLKFAGYFHHYKILPGYIFGLILKNRKAAMGATPIFQL